MDQFILIGHPVGHSLSPVIHGRAYDYLGISARYDLVDCPSSADVTAQVERLRSGEIRGANVTVPHKATAFDLVDRVSQTAARVGVANVLAREDDGGVVAHNTDASGLARQLRRCAGRAQLSPERRHRALVLGNGGAARGAVVACHLAGIDQVAVTSRSFIGLDPAGYPQGRAFRDLGAELLPWWTESEAAARTLFEAGFLIQATSAGMTGVGGGETLAELVPWAGLPSLVVYDLVYHPRTTPLLARARALGHLVEDGLSMLVGQAKDALSIWLDQDVPEELLLQAAEDALSS